MRIEPDRLILWAALVVIIAAIASMCRGADVDMGGVITDATWTEYSAGEWYATWGDAPAPDPHPLADWQSTNTLLFGVDYCTNGADDIGSGRYLDYQPGIDPPTYNSATGGFSFTSGDIATISGTGYTTFLNARTTASVACWIKRDTTGTSYPMSCSNSTAGIGFQAYSAGVRGLLRAVVTSPTDALPVDEWHHIACVFTNTASPPDGIMYIDGAQAGSVSIANGSLAQSVRYVIGAYAEGSGHFEGTLDDIGIWSSALTATQVSNQWAGTIGTKQ